MYRYSIKTEQMSRLTAPTLHCLSAFAYTNNVGTLFIKRNVLIVRTSATAVATQQICAHKKELRIKITLTAISFDGSPTHSVLFMLYWWII